MSKLFFRYGCMNSSKSAELLITAYNYKKKNMSVLILKPQVDTRNSEKIFSRIGIEKNCLVLDKNVNLYKYLENQLNQIDYKCILIDESQFLTKNQVRQLWEFVVTYKLPAICYGLRVDYKCEGFEGSEALFTLAHDIKEIKTICKCGKKATNHLLKINNEYIFCGEQIHIGDSEFEEVCSRCYLKVKKEVEKNNP